MQARKTLFFFLVLAFLLPVASWSADADRSSSDYWIEKLASYYADSAPYTLVFAMEMKMSQQGANLDITAGGDMLFASPERMRTRIDMTMAMDMLPEPMKMSMLMVHDGETIWTEMDNPMVGGKQVMKLSAAAAKEIQAKAGLGSGFSSDQIDPAAQAKMLSQMMDLTVSEIAGGSVRLEGAINEEFVAKMGQMAEAFGTDGLGRVVITLDEKTGAMRQMTMGDPEAPALSMVYEDMKLIPKAELPADAFRYTPPEGVPVQDLTEALRQAQEATEAQEASPAPVQ